MRKFFNVLAASIAASIAGLAGGATVSAQTFVWDATAYNDANNKGRYTAYLTQGVPETDNQQFRASCSPGGGDAFAPTVMAYNMNGLPSGRRVTVKFFQNGQEVYQKPGEVYVSAGEEGISGVLLRPGVDDYFWKVLSRGQYIRYEINGLGKAGMNLTGSTRAIKKFQKDCRAILSATNSGSSGGVDDSDNEENNVASAKSCDRFRNAKSRDSRVPVTVRFVNRSGGYRSVMWIDYKGRPVHYKDLNPGESYSQKTYVGHPWMFTDGPGNCKEMFVPKRGSKRFNIRFSG